MNKSNIIYLFVLSMIEISRLFGQQDTLKIGDVVTSQPIKTLNDWRSCRHVSDEDLLILDTLNANIGFSERLISIYSKDSKCVFYKMWNYELQRSKDIYKHIAKNLFKYKPYRENSEINPIMAYALYKYIKPIIEFDCNYFDSITKVEFNNPQSSFNRIIYLIFNKTESSLENELQTNKSECYIKNVEIIKRSLDISKNIK